jgi:hypothetical protein
MGPRLCRIGSCLALLFGASAGWTQPGSDAARAVSGLAPHERPEAAPRMGDFAPDPAWQRNALRGVSEPVPPSLRFLQSQGRWYSPFVHPGMTGRYDIRGLHPAKPD